MQPWMQHTSVVTIQFKGKVRIHGRIIKWTQHIGFLTLDEMARVVEGNHGNDLKEGYQKFCVYRVW